MSKKCRYSDIFSSVFSHIWTEYEYLLCKSPYWLQMREYKDQKNSEYGHFLRREPDLGQITILPRRRRK